MFVEKMTKDDVRSKRGNKYKVFSIVPVENYKMFS